MLSEYRQRRLRGKAARITQP